MDRLIGAWDGGAETAIRDRYFDEPAQTMHEYIEDQKDKVWHEFEQNAPVIFRHYDMLAYEETHPLFQELVTLGKDRYEYGAVGSSFEALGRAAYAWMTAEVDRIAEPNAPIKCRVSVKTEDGESTYDGIFPSTCDAVIDAQQRLGGNLRKVSVEAL